MEQSQRQRPTFSDRNLPDCCLFLDRNLLIFVNFWTGICLIFVNFWTGICLIVVNFWTGIWLIVVNFWTGICLIVVNFLSGICLIVVNLKTVFLCHTNYPVLICENKIKQTFPSPLFFGYFEHVFFSLNGIENNLYRILLLRFGVTSSLHKVLRNNLTLLFSANTPFCIGTCYLSLEVSAGSILAPVLVSLSVYTYYTVHMYTCRLVCYTVHVH